MVKTKNRMYAVIAVLLSVFMLVSMFTFVQFSKPKSKVSAVSTLTEEQKAERRAHPGIYTSGTTELLQEVVST